MRILYAALKHDYGDPLRGYSFEHFNFFHALRHGGHDILYFDFFSLMQRFGRDTMNRRLLEIAKAEKPDVMFAVLFNDELDPDAIQRVSSEAGVLTVNWFCDDHYRFESFSRRYAPSFDYVVTTARSALPKYERLGYANVIKSQWAANHHLYRKLDLPLKHDVTFVGQPHGDRRAMVEAIRAAGIKVEAWGAGWESGRLSQDQMIEVFNQSHINLNFSNAASPVPTARLRMRAGAQRVLRSVPLGSSILAAAKKILRYQSAQPAPAGGSTYFAQIKGRNFEVPGCGGFMLTGPAEDLGSYYRPGEEVAVFQSVPELIDKLHTYLGDEDRRAAVARAGYGRTIREHTYAHRFHEIFTRMRLPWRLEDALACRARPGDVMEINA